MNQHVPVMDGDTLARRNALVLAGAQALGGASPAIVISLGGIVGSQLVSNQAFATVPVSLMQLIYRHAEYETVSRDYEFSRLSMRDHWQAGLRDAVRSLSHPRWTGRELAEDGLFIFDVQDPHEEQPPAAPAT